MFVREKTINGSTYLYLVESVREGARTKQRIIKNLGRKGAVLASGELDRLAASVARFAERALVLSAVERGDTAGLTCRRIGPPLLFGRLWEETGVKAVVDGLLAARAFEFPVERAIFAAVLHRLMTSGSDRACERWLADYAIPGAEGLALHHFDRAMAWLGEELAAAEQAGATPFAPRTVKDLVEERLFERRRDLFSELSVVFLDTTSLSFTGSGGATLGARGHSKERRPDLNQMIVAVVIDAEGRPVCSEMWPGNTADVGVLVPVVDRLRHRFGITRACVVADRGMISAATIAALEERGLEYVLGVRERGDKLVREVVLEDGRPFMPLLVERAKGETQLFVKEVSVAGRRHIVCRNEAEAAKDAADRAAIIEGLDRQLKKGDKALIGNSAYRRYLRRIGPRGDKPGPAFEIDVGKIADEARFDGVFVLAHQRPDHAAAGRAALPRPPPGRGAVPHGQGPAAHPARLPRLRRGHPGPRLLLVPRPGPAQGAADPLRGRRDQAGVGQRAARPRPAAGGRARQGRQAPGPAHAHDRRRRPAVPGRPRRPAAQRPRGWAGRLTAIPHRRARACGAKDRPRRCNLLTMLDLSKRGVQVGLGVPRGVLGERRRFDGDRAVLGQHGKDMGCRGDVDADEMHGAPLPLPPGASEPVPMPMLVHARMTAPIGAVIRPLVAAPPDTVRAESTGRGRQSHSRGQTLGRTAATLSRPSGQPPYQEASR